MNPLLRFLGSICDPDFLAFFHWRFCQIVWSNCLIGQHRNLETKRELGAEHILKVSNFRGVSKFLTGAISNHIGGFLDITCEAFISIDELSQKIYVQDWIVEMALLGSMRA